MKTSSKSAARAVALIAIGALGLAGCGSAASPSVGERQTAAPTLSPRPSASQSAAAATPPASTEAFTSARNGFSISYPAGWMTRPATEPWTKDVPDFMSPAGDIFHDPVREADLWISVASQPIGASTPDQWAAEKLAFDDGCTASKPITVDGATGVIGADGCTRAGRHDRWPRVLRLALHGRRRRLPQRPLRRSVVRRRPCDPPASARG